MKKWVFFSDLIFTFFVTFLPTLCLLRYFRFSLFSSVVVAILLGIGITCIVATSKRKKDVRLTLKRSEEREKRLLLYHLALLPPKDALSLLYPDEKPSKRADLWIIEKEKLICPCFLWEPLAQKDALPFLRLCLKTNKEGLILCDEITENTAAFLGQFPIQVLKGEELYNRLKQEGRLPSSYLSEPYFTKKKKRLARVWFAKSNSRRFLTCGVLLLLSSLLVPFSYYYIVFGLLAMIAAVLIRAFGYR